MSEDRGQDEDEIEDIGDMVLDFNILPDCILEHILSFMPTKEAVKTSVLSTRWKNLWASVPNIDIDDKFLRVRDFDGWYPPKVTSFVNFVKRVLRLRGALKLEKFSLTSYHYSSSPQINSWISDAITHNVQKLDLRFSVWDPSMIPWSMFDSNTSLSSLKLYMPSVIKLPSHVSFPCSKTLHLSSIAFPNGDSTQTLLSSSPVLEELVLSACWWINPNHINIVISSSTLKSLTINDPPYLSGIEINASNLICFQYTGCLPNKILLNNASSLVKVCIDIPTPCERKKEAACRVVDLLKDLRYAVYLSVSNGTMESLKFTNNMPVHFLVFPNLIHLTLTTKIKNYTFGVVMDFLSFCPVLQSICFSEGLNRFMRLVENHPVWSSIPICMKTCLKTLTLKDFHGYKSEICFLKCVLKYACVLERMDIWGSERYVQDLKRKRKVMKELENIERRSTTCVIKFS